MRAFLCRHGIEQMRADAEEAARRCAEVYMAATWPTLLHGIARVLGGDLDGGDALFEDAIRNRESGAPDVVAATLCERSMAAMTRREWNQAEALANDATAVLQKAGMEDCYVSPLLNAVQARLALHRGDVPAARQELVSAQRLRRLLSYALPYLAVQARIELARSHLALADRAGARTLMREIDEILKWRPDLGTLVGEARTFRAQLSKQRDLIVPGPSALTAAELRLLPMLATHLQMHEIAAEMYLSPHTVRTQAKSVYRRLGASTRGQAVARARELGLLEG